MAAPHRGNTGSGTYFITASTFQKQHLLQSERMARLFLDVLLNYRSQEKYLPHEFVLMPDHFHLLITPLLTLERALQLIKGSFSFRAKKELGFQGEIWEESFYDRRVRDWEEYRSFFANTFIAIQCRDAWPRSLKTIRIVRQYLDWRWMQSRSG